MPLISIIIPTYNQARFLDKALISVINQTYKNWEILIINNKSIDETYSVAHKYKDTRIKYFEINNKGIIAKSRNLGIKVSQGEWIAFLDSDDWWTEDKLETCLENIDDNVDLIYHKLEIVYEQSKSYFKKNIGRQLNKPILRDLLVGMITKGNAIGNSSVIVRKHIFNKTGYISENPKIVSSEDFNTWLKIAKLTNQFKYVDKKLGYYRVHDKSVQKKKNLSIPHREALIEFMDFLNDKEKLSLETKLKFMSGNFNIFENNFIKAKNDFLFVFKNGGINLKFRSLLKIILIIIKQYRNNKN